MLRITFVALSFGAVLVGPGNLSAAFVPAGLNPGDSYHLMIVTAGSRDGTSSVAADYDAFVQAQANQSGLTSGVVWKAIVSTETVDARDHALVEAPVYLLNNYLFANDITDMWNGLDDAEHGGIRNQFGQLNTWLVHTGTRTDGTAGETAFLGHGGGLNWFGNSNTQSSEGWIRSGTMYSSSSGAVYGLSEKLTVPGPVPVEPTSWSRIKLLMNH